jgi:hypothetical protein
MTRKSIQEINIISYKGYSRKTSPNKKHMPIVKCVCGYEILVIPDLKAMNLAVKKHLVEHKKSSDNAEWLEEFLAEQVLIVASKINPQ